MGRFHRRMIANQTPHSPLLIVVSGPPCAGKTTLAQRIAQEFRLPLVAKDDIKESLFDSLGWQDREWSKKLGCATFELLFYFAETQLAAKRSLIVEANFAAEFHAEKFRVLQAKHSFVPLQIICRADRAILTQRFRTRWESGARHRGHVDNEINAQELDTILKRYVAPLDIGGEVIEINTTNFDKVDYAGLFAKIAMAIKLSPTEVRSR
jgi:predicted kinase